MGDYSYFRAEGASLAAIEKLEAAKATPQQRFEKLAAQFGASAARASKTQYHKILGHYYICVPQDEQGNPAFVPQDAKPVSSLDVLALSRQEAAAKLTYPGIH